MNVALPHVYVSIAFSSQDEWVVGEASYIHLGWNFSSIVWNLICAEDRAWVRRLCGGSRWVTTAASHCSVNNSIQSHPVIASQVLHIDHLSLPWLPSLSFCHSFSLSLLSFPFLILSSLLFLSSFYFSLLSLLPFHSSHSSCSLLSHYLFLCFLFLPSLSPTPSLPPTSSIPPSALPSSRLPTNGSFYPNWQQCVMNFETNATNTTIMECSFTKQSNDTVLKIAWNGSDIYST